MPSKQEWFQLSYIGFFVATFLVGVSLPLVPTVLQIPAQAMQDNAWTSTANTTMYNSWSAAAMVPITGMLVVAIFITFALSGFAMTRGME